MEGGGGVGGSNLEFRRFAIFLRLIFAKFRNSGLHYIPSFPVSRRELVPTLYNVLYMYTHVWTEVGVLIE